MTESGIEDPDIIDQSQKYHDEEILPFFCDRKVIFEDVREAMMNTFKAPHCARIPDLLPFIRRRKSYKRAYLLERFNRVSHIAFVRDQFVSNEKSLDKIKRIIGTVYLIFPITKIRCDERTLESLLLQVYNYCDFGQIHNSKKPLCSIKGFYAAPGTTWEMGEQINFSDTDGVWFHPLLEKEIRNYIAAVLKGRREIINGDMIPNNLIIH